MHQFTTGSWVHIATLTGCVVAIVLYSMACWRHRTQFKFPRLGKLTAWSCLVTWVFNTAIAFLPEFFQWDSSLPLYYCNWANALGALAIFTSIRVFSNLLYFWACGLSIWAFLTPTLQFGPGHVGFWIFWGYHLWIGFAVAFVVIVKRFRPNLKDLWLAIVITILYGLCLVAINVPTGWNYAFLGPTKPNAPTLIDDLGPFPLRLVWIALLASASFAILTLPWNMIDAIKKAGYRK